MKKFNVGRKLIYPEEIPEITNDVMVFDFLGIQVNGIIDDDEKHHGIFEEWKHLEIDVESQPFLVDRTLGAFIKLWYENKKIEYTITLSKGQALLLTNPRSKFGIFTTKGEVKYLFISFLEDTIVDILREKDIADTIKHRLSDMDLN